MDETRRLELVEEFKTLWARVTRPGADKVMAFLEKSDFFTAPASTKYHASYPGGLVEHSLNVYRLLSGKIGEAATAPWPNGEEAVKIPEESVIITALLHDLCKVNTYVAEKKNRKTYDRDKIAAANSWEVKQDSAGSYIWEAYDGYSWNDQCPYGHGEKSVYLAMAYGLKLTNKEAFMIRWHMGYTAGNTPDMWEKFAHAAQKYPEVLAMFEADVEATYVCEKE